MDKLRSIREDVRAHLPELSLAGLADIRAHLPDLPAIPDVPSMSEMREHYFPSVRSHLPDLDEMMNKFNDVKTRFHDLDFNRPLTFVPTLSEHLNDLHDHLSSIQVPHGLEVTSQFMGSLLSDMIDRVMKSEMMTDLLAAAPDIGEGEAMVEKTAKEVAKAIKRSFEGVKLISYSDLPYQWRNNPFVTQGYR
jgi:adiponectin receptor